MLSEKPKLSINAELPFIEKPSDIRREDPLSLKDFLLTEFVDWNINNKKEPLIAVANHTGKSLTQLLDQRIFTYSETQATILHCGFIINSLAKQGVDIGTKAPQLEEGLLKLMEKTGIKNPIWGFVHYVHFNDPESPITLTGSEAEKEFIKRLREGDEAWLRCLLPLLQARTKDIRQPEFIKSIEEVNKYLDAPLAAMIEVRKTITPDIFTPDIAPYFPELKVFGMKFPSPSGAQSAIGLIDRLMWGLDATSDSVYEDYFQEIVYYMPKLLHEFGLNLSGQSLLEKIKNEADGSASSIAAIEAYEQAALKILKFDAPHKKTIAQNMELREEKVGGAGMGMETVEMLSGYRRRAVKEVHNLLLELKNSN